MRIADYASPEELRRLVAGFMTVLLALTVAALFEFMVVPSLRLATRPAAGPPTAQQGATGWLDPTEYPPSKGYLQAPVDSKAVMTATSQLLDQGRAIFPRHCAQCHGAEGLGDGPAAKTTDPAPRNFTQPRGWKNGYGLAAIYKTMSTGIAGSAMAAFDYLPARDRMALAHYVQSLALFQRGPEDPAALAALAKSFAAAGAWVPNKIPVSWAMRKLVEEYAAPKALVLSGVAARVVSDPQRAAVWLRNSTAWRAGPKALAEAVAAQAPENGFAVSVEGLDPAKWSSLYAELRGLR